MKEPFSWIQLIPMFACDNSQLLLCPQFCLSRASLRVVLAEAFTGCTTPLGNGGGQVKSWRLGPSVLNAQCAKWKNL